jgi:hypothetical protein
MFPHTSHVESIALFERNASALSKLPAATAGLTCARMAPLRDRIFIGCNAREDVMHMADALLSPAVGGTLWAVSAATIAYCSKKVTDELDERKVPLMGVLGAFLFAAQMINFSIPGTGSSGHLGVGCCWRFCSARMPRS